ncbi:helix-turn-helix domain-containing protein [Burkholderia multivorans]|nr:helix-turn-helix domain-containing protein [Burkholderia multivorans]MDN8018153.1 helix-turn-helix domain-containing protein [Burkholderia multivorans]
MAGHLDVLMNMFPQKAMLNADDLAKALNVSRQHIYNLCHVDKLPFKLEKAKGSKTRIQVSIIEVARYLDSKLEVREVKREEIEVVDKPKVGRPRGGGKIKLTRAFQSELTIAIVQEEAEEAFSKLQEQIDSMKFEDNGKSPSERFEEAKNHFLDCSVHARNVLRKNLLSLKLNEVPAPPRARPFKQ